MIETVRNKMQLVAADICNNNPVTLEGNKTLYDARNILLKYNISRVIILKGRNCYRKRYRSVPLCRVSKEKP
jgi:predicted transcriptional regulator